MLAVLQVVHEGEGHDALRKVLARIGGLPRSDGNSAKSPIPARLPRELFEALALCTRLGVEDAVSVGGPITNDGTVDRRLAERLPEDVRALYRLHDGVGERELVPQSELPALQARLAASVEDHLKEADGEVEIDAADGIDLRRLLPVGDLIALGTDAAGDFFIVAPNVRASGRALPILRFCHDELCTVRPHSRSIAEFVAKLMVAAWNRRHGPDERAEKLLREGGFRVKLG